MFCPKCGAQNADDIAFCTNCGNQLNNNQQQAQQAQQAPQQPVYQQPVYQQPVYQQPMAPAPVVPGKGMSIASMVLGIASLVFFCAWYIAIPCSIVGVILGALGMKKAKMVGMKSGMAVAGIVCSCIALAVTIIYTIIIAVAVSSAYGYVNDLYNLFDY